MKRVLQGIDRFAASRGMWLAGRPHPPGTLGDGAVTEGEGSAKAATKPLSRLRALGVSGTALRGRVRDENTDEPKFAQITTSVHGGEILL